MSTPTLSQRLRELKAAIQGGNFSAFATLDECITQAEAQEQRPKNTTATSPEQSNTHQ